MVREYGLSAKVGPVGYPQGGSVFLGGGGNGFSSRPFAESTQAAIDAEVARLLREAEQTAVDLIREHQDMLDRLVELLLEHETVDGGEVYRIVGKPAPVHRPDEVSIGPRAKVPSLAKDGQVAKDAAAAVRPDTVLPDIVLPDTVLPDADGSGG